MVITLKMIIKCLSLNNFCICFSSNNWWLKVRFRFINTKWSSYTSFWLFAWFELHVIVTLYLCINLCNTSWNWIPDLCRLWRSWRINIFFMRFELIQYMPSSPLGPYKVELCPVLIFSRLSPPKSSFKCLLD